MQGSPRKGPSGKAQEGRQQLQELLSCQICYCRALQPTLCPHCSKLYCEDCLSASLRTRPECPNCRRSLRGTVVQCGRFVGEVAAVLQKLLEGSEQTQRCAQHGIALNYFCSDCRRSACCECKMFGKHQHHHFSPISQLYEHKYQQIRDLLSQLRTRIVQQEHLLTETENLLIGAKGRTQAHLTEIEEHAEKYRLKMGGECVEEGVDLEELRKEGADLAEIKQALLGQLEHALKANCYKLDQDLLDRLEALLVNHSNRSQQVRSASAAEEAMPPLLLHTCTLTNYSKMRAERQVFYSENVEYEGSKWRLVVYPGGSTSSSRSVSAFLELLVNPDTLNLYLYHIELLHPNSQPTLSLSKHHHARFSPNESLGYAKFITHEDLHQKQLVNESEDTLTLTFGVRFCTYFDLYSRRQNLTAYLEGQIAEREARISELESSGRSTSSIELQ